MLRNVASQVVQCGVAALEGGAFTGTVTVSVTGDGGTRATGSVGSGICTNEGGGVYSYLPSQAETNYATVTFDFSGTGATVAYRHYEPAAAPALNSDMATALSALTAIGNKTVNLPTDPADASDIAAATTTIAGYIDTEVAAIKAKTDNLPTDPADQSLIIAAADAIMARLGAPAGASISADIAAVDAGGGGGLDAAGMRAALGMATANMDTHLNAIQTAIANKTLSAAEVDLIFEEGVEGSITLRQSMMLLVALAAGTTTGMHLNQPVWRNPANTKNRIAATMDSNRNRLTVIVDFS